MLQILCSLLFMLFTSSNCSSDFLLIRKNNTNYCITNNNAFGLTWIDRNISNKSSAPEFRPIEISCNKELESSCNEYLWMKRNSSDDTDNELLLDRRWELLETQNYSTISGWNRVLALTRNHQYAIPFSLLFKQEAQIAICTNRDLRNSSCLDFTLSKPNDQPKENYLDTYHKWLHYKFIKRKNNFTLYQTSSRKTQNISLQESDTYYIMIKCRYGFFWKLHGVEYNFANKESSEIHTGIVINPHEGKICLSMFVKMCQGCKMKLSYKSEPAGIIKEEEYGGSSKWKEIKFDADYDVPLALLVSTVGFENYTNFWAISDIRQCQKREFHMIVSRESKKCQLIAKTDNDIISLEKNKFDSEIPKNGNCSENTVGRSCVICSRIFQGNNCGRLKYCEWYDDHSICSCSTGSQRNNCECPSGYFGDYCKEKCGHCVGQKCDTDHGTCYSCTDGFTGPKCDTPPKNRLQDLSISWTFNNELELNWKFYKNSNQHKNFLITIVPVNKSEFADTIPVPINDNVTYHYKISASRIVMSATYQIKIMLDDLQNNDALMINSTTSPPNTPEFASHPKYSSDNNSITVEIPGKISTRELKETISNHYDLFLYIFDESHHWNHPELEKFDMKLPLNLSSFRTVYECSLQDSYNTIFIIGKNNQVANCKNQPNAPLLPGVCYNVTIVLTHTFENMTRYKLYSLNACTINGPESASSSVAFVVVLLAGLAGFTILMITISTLAVKKFGHCHQRTSVTQNATETTPMHDLQEENDQLTTYSKLCVCSKPIEVEMFYEYVKTSVRSNEFALQHKAVLQNIACGVYEKVYENMFFEYVTLYYSNGEYVPKAYIVSEVPKYKSRDIFWNMVWTENVRCILLIDEQTTNEETEVQYWPELNDKLEFRNISVQCTYSKLFSDYVWRTFALTCEGKSRHVNQIHFLAWQEHTTPISASIFADFFEETLKVLLIPKSPILVHCSTGAGGTGFVVLCDMCLRVASRDGIVDLSKCLQQLGSCSLDLIRNFDHYFLAHLAILEVFLHSNVNVKRHVLESDKPVAFGTDEINSYWDYIRRTLWLDDILQSKQESGKIYLQMIGSAERKLLEPASSKNKKYYLSHLNAIKLRTFNGLDELIILSQPRIRTLDDFWRLVAEYGINGIVSLNEVDPALKTCYFWPSDDYPELQYSRILKVKHEKTEKFQCYDWITISLHLNGQQDPRKIDIFALKNWSAHNNSPQSISSFVSFCIGSYHILNKANSVVVTCHDGTKASGLYAAMLHIMCTSATGVCDVCKTIRMIRSHRLEFFKDKEQLVFLCRTVEHYIKESQLYVLR